MLPFPGHTLRCSVGNLLLSSAEMGNSFGQLFRITTFGESHAGGVGVVIDGCPPRIPLVTADIQRELDRRRPGQSELVTARQEADRCEILSGVFEGQTLGHETYKGLGWFGVILAGG